MLVAVVVVDPKATTPTRTVTALPLTILTTHIRAADQANRLTSREPSHRGSPNHRAAQVARQLRRRERNQRTKAPTLQLGTATVTETETVTVIGTIRTRPKTRTDPPWRSTIRRNGPHFVSKSSSNNRPNLNPRRTTSEALPEPELYHYSSSSLELTHRSCR